MKLYTARRRVAVRGALGALEGVRLTVSPVAVKMLEGLELTRGNPEALEKFQDPLYDCFGTGPDRGIDYRWLAWHRDVEAGGTLASNGPFLFNGDWIEGRVVLGYEYLAGVPNIARDRIRNIRQKISEYVASNPLPPLNSNASMGQPLEMLRYASWKNLEQISTGISKRFGKNAKAIVEAVPGMSWESATNIANEIDSTYKLSDQVAARYQTIAVATKNIAPVAIAITNAVAKTIGIMTSDVSDEQKANLTAHTIASIIALVPGYGTAVAAAMSFVLSFWDASIAKERAQAEEYARLSGEALSDLMKQTSDKGVPPPFHATEMWQVGFSASAKTTVPPTYYASKGFKGSPWQWELDQNLRYNLDVFSGTVKSGPGVEASTGNGLTGEQVDNVKQWWATAIMFMSDPGVFDVFRALGWDALGGTIASDEQVMLVAAPIAASRGFNIDKFAMALHAKSKGWREELAANGGAIRSQRRSYWSPDHDWFIRGRKEARETSGGYPEDPITNMPILSTEWAYCNDGSQMPVQNAWWLNLAALSRDALEMAESFGEESSARIEKDLPSLGETASALATVALPAAAGVAAGFLFGGPIGLAVGAASWILSSWLTSESD